MDPNTIRPINQSAPKKCLIEMPPIGSPRLALSSFTRPRDLLLGGVPGTRLLARANVTPNLNVCRRKQSVKIENNLGKRSFEKSERGGRTPNRGKRGGKSGLVQTVSIFSEGVGPSDLPKPSHSSATSSSRKREENAGTVTRKSTGKRSEARSEETIDESIEEYLEKMDEPYVDINKIGHINPTGPIHLSEHILPNAKKFPFTYPETVKEMIVEDGRLILMQVPEGIIPKSTNSTKPNENQSSMKEEPGPSNAPDTSEGQIGVLRRYKSGKVEMVIDGVVFNATAGMTNGFSQHLVSIRQNEDKTYDAINLGEITGKLSVFPRFTKVEDVIETFDLTDS